MRGGGDAGGDAGGDGPGAAADSDGRGGDGRGGDGRDDGRNPGRVSARARGARQLRPAGGAAARSEKRSPRRDAWARGWRGIALALGAGAALALAQPPYGVFWTVFIAVPLLAVLTAAASRRGAFFIGWAAGTAFFAAGLNWIAEPFLVDAARYGWMAPFAVALMSGGLALFWGLAFGVARRLWPRRRPDAPLSIVAGALVFAGAWALAEALRSYMFTGFPWALPAYGWVDTPLAQAASLFGPHMLGFAGIFAAALPGLALRGGPGGGRRTAAALAASLALILGGWGWGAARLAAPAPAPEGRVAPVLRIVQPNAPQKDKWNPEKIPVFWARLLALSAPGPGEPRPDLVIWPETAVPFFLDRDDTARRLIAEAGGGAPVVLGARRVNARGDWFNAMQVVDAAGEVAAAYDKAHLVPFGEYVPLFGLLDALGIGALVGESGGFTPGDGAGAGRMALPGLPAFAPQICYETIFPQEAPFLDRRPDWILQITNDAWFGARAGPIQHFQQARMRAIEQGLPLVRAANTGVSAVIDARGRVTARLGLHRSGALQADLPPPLPPTLYAQSGDAPWLALIAALLSFGALAGRGRARRRRDAEA